MYWVKIGKHFVNLGNAQQVFDRRDIEPQPNFGVEPHVFVRWEKSSGNDEDPRRFYGEEADELMRHLESLRQNLSGD